MELRRRLDLRKVVGAVYFVAAFLFLVIGLQPVAAQNYELAAWLRIPKIGLELGVAKVGTQDNELMVPDELVGSFSQAENKTLLVGHRTTVFNRLGEAMIGDEIDYDGDVYVVSGIEVVPKEEIWMWKILETAEKPTIVLMTCAGEIFEDGDATKRLIVTAEKV